MWDHPRVRGEKTAQNYMRIAREGSPPRARGKVIVNKDNSDLAGITPACAGKSCDGCAGSMTGWDHPRVRGEKSYGA